MQIHQEFTEGHFRHQKDTTDGCVRQNDVTKLLTAGAVTKI
jgi:hypothetical protein